MHACFIFFFFDNNANEIYIYILQNLKFKSGILVMETVIILWLKFNIAFVISLNFEFQ